ncbi:MAG TPA: hypothetical protein VHD59_16710 [Pseudolabrys sp.]|jgi:hypothetical protein|nr:hypothetical protein [Pseudolabrys sp.]
MAMNGFHEDLETKAGESRALVALEPAAERRPGTAAPAAPFLAQLLAVKANLPQTRDRRRAEPDEATHSYETSMAPRPAYTGRVLSRAM